MAKAKAQDAPDLKGGDNAANVAGQQLLAGIQRIERMNEEATAIKDDVKDIYAELKGNGFDVKIIRKIVRRRAMDRNERLEQDALQETYEHAIGMAPAPDEDDDGNSD